MSVFIASHRALGGSKTVKLRREGFIPMGLVERNHVTLPLKISLKDFQTAMSQGVHTQVDVQIEGEATPRKAVVQHIEKELVSQKVVHVVLQEVSKDDFVKLEVPVIAVGVNEETQIAGVTLTQMLDHLKLRGHIADLPERIEVDISGLHAGETLAASSVVLPEGVELLTPADATLFGITVNRGLEIPAPEEVVEAAPVEE